MRSQPIGALRGSRLRSGLVIGQVAVSLVLVIVALTLARNGAAIGAIDLGFESEGVISINVRDDMSWQSRAFFTPANDAIETQGAYGLLHLRAAFEPRSRRWEMAVYARNVGNREYITGSANVPIPAFTGRPGDPRHWGTQFTIRR